MAEDLKHGTSEHSVKATLERVREYLEVVLRVGVALAAIAYFNGLLVVLKYQATFGISDMDLLRPKVIAAGALFLTMFALSVLAVIPYIQLSAKPSSEPPVAAHRRAALRVIDAGFYIAFVTIAILILDQVFLDTHGAAPLNSLLVLGLLVPHTIVTGTFLILGRVRPGLLWLCAIVVGASIGGVIFAAIKTWPSADLKLAFWVVMVGVLVVNARGIVTNGPWHSWPHAMLVFIATGVVVGYATNVHGNISASWGGGKPRPVTIFLRAAQPYIDGTALHVLLIDETSSGYYITQSREDTSALFLPRDQILAVRYSRQSSDVQRADDATRDASQQTPEPQPTQGTTSAPHDGAPR
jgi:hypothetical protein